MCEEHRAEMLGWEQNTGRGLVAGEGKNLV
jgi:hypothetical protein